MKPLLYLISLCIILGCENEPIVTALENDYQLEDTITIPYRSFVSISSENLYLGFKAVKEEARCPYEWDCLWAGHATIQLSVQKGDFQKSIELMAQGRCDTYCGNTGIYSNYDIQLINVLPYPEDNNYTPQSNYEDYKLVIVVSKKENALPAAIGIQS